jgi:uncharacterized protein YjeT (DUF2065 family)
MSTLSMILIVLAIIIILEGLLITLFPIQLKKAFNQILKNKRKIQTLGIIELIIGIIILGIGISLM